jgi:hypothetical protein
MKILALVVFLSFLGALYVVRSILSFLFDVFDVGMNVC